MSLVIIILIITLLTAVLVYHFVIAYQLVYSLSHPKRFDYPIKSNVPLTYRKFDIVTADGKMLKGIDYKPKMKSRGTILACHYLGGSKEAVLQFFDSLVGCGFRVLSFDFRNHGESDNDRFVKNSMENDFDTFFKAIKAMGVEGPFGTIGFSMGSTPALYALKKYPEVKAVVVDSGPLIKVRKYFVYVLDNKNIKNPLCRLFFLAIYLYYVGFVRMAGKTVKMLKTLKGKPVFLIHGVKDNIITIENAEFAYSLLESENSIFWKVKNTRHLTNKCINEKEYSKRLNDFFEKNLIGKVEG